MIEILIKHFEIIMKALAYCAVTSGGKFRERCEEVHVNLIEAIKESEAKQ